MTCRLRNGSLLLALAVPVLLFGQRREPRVFGQWIKDSNLQEARAGACTVSLLDGRRLTTGGQNRRGPLSSAEYLGIPGGLAAVSPMGVARSEHVCAPLPDGTVLVAGGRVLGDAATNAAEIYDPASDTWTHIPSMREARIGATLTQLSDKRLLIAGGEFSGIASVSLEIFDPVTRTFNMVSGAMASPRKGHAASLLPGGRVLIAGGSNGRTALDTAELFDPATGTIQPVGKLTVARQGLSATLLDNHMVILAGGSNGREDLASSELFDANTLSFSPGPSMGSARRGHQAFLMPHNNTVILVGGTSAGAPLASAEQFAWWGNQYRGQFKSIGDLSSARTKTTGAAGEWGLLTIAGGAALAGAALSDTVSLVAATVTTDKLDYQPGDIVYLSGANFGPNDVVHVVIHETPTTHPDVRVDVQADANGAFSNKPVYNVELHDLGVTFHLIATGDPSGFTAETSFTDGSLDTATITMKNATLPSTCLGTNDTTFNVGDGVCASVLVATSGGGAAPNLYIQWYAPGYTPGVTAPTQETIKSSVANGSTHTDIFDTTGKATGTWTVVGCRSTGACTATPGTGQNRGQTTFTLSAALSAPSISKAFGAATIPVGGTTTLTFTITNPNPSTTLTGVAFSDTFPAGLEVDDPPAPTNSCGGTFAPADGATTVSLTGGSIAGGGSCMIVVTVKGTTAGVKPNLSGSVSSTNGGTGNTASASVTVLSPPTISKAFGAATIPLNGTTTLTFTLSNSNAVPLTGVAFSDTFPVGLVVMNPPAPGGTCVATVTAVDGAGSVSVTAGTIPASGSCTIIVTVKGTTPGAKDNTTGAIDSANGGLGTTSNTATVTVVAPPTISKMFSPSTIPLNSISTITFTIDAPAANSVSLTGISFIDTLSGMVVAPTPNVTGSCPSGTITAMAGAGSISLAGAMLAPGASCSFTVDVKGTAAGSQVNSVQVTSTNGGTGNTAMATLTVIAPPTITKGFSPAQIPQGTNSSLSFIITNPNTGSSLSGISFADALPMGLVVATPNGLGGTCTGTITATPGSGSISLSGGTLAASGSCSFSVNVTGAGFGVKNNTTSAIMSTEGGTGTTSNTATLTVVAPPTISKAFGASSIPFGGTTSLTFTINNPNTTVALTGIAFSDTLVAGLMVATPPGASNTCGGMLTATAGSSSVSLSAGGPLAAGGSCMISVNVLGTTLGLKSNTTGAISSTEGGTGTTSNTASVTVMPAPTVSMVTVAPSTQQYSDKVTFTATLSPASILGEAPATGVTFYVGTPGLATAQNMGSCPLVVSGPDLTCQVLNVPLLEPAFPPPAPGNMAPGGHTVYAVFSGVSPFFAVGTPTTSLTITQEDARATYTGALFASTASATSTNATVTLSATIQDITATPDAAGDTDSGDIRNAKVTLLLGGAGGAPIAGCTNRVPGLVNPGDTKTGTVTCTWNVTITPPSESFTIGIRVNHYYTREHASENTVVTVSQPLNDFITGGGYLIMGDASSAGLAAGKPGSKNNFGFNVKYNKSGKNLQGHINTIVRSMLKANPACPTRDMYVYQIKGNAMTSLAVNAVAGTATFNGKANIKDITDPLLTCDVDGNATLQVTMDDNGEPGKDDKIGITVWNKDGGLWFASDWNGTQTVEKTLGGGNLVVH